MVVKGVDKKWSLFDTNDMNQPAQILLVVVVIVLTALLTAIGIQVYLILKEAKKSVEKINKILDDTGTITESVAKPVSSLSSSLTNFSGVAGILSLLLKKKKKPEAEVTNE